MGGISNMIFSVNGFLLFFWRKLRLSNPWNHKVPLLITFPYLLLLLGDYKGTGVGATLASLAIIVGVAGFGYLTNDLGDKQKDGIIKKENATTRLSTPSLLSLYTFFLCMSLLPWFFLAVDKWSCLLLALQFLLFCMYSLPPFRLKERGLAGVITDALYAHVNPALLAAYTFYLYTGTFSGFPLLLILLGSWQFLAGVRNILLHQMRDLEDDIRSGTRTYTTTMGKAWVLSFSRNFVMPLEVALFLLFAAFVSQYLYFFLPLIILFWLVRGAQVGRRGPGAGYKEFTYLYFDDLYTMWVPLFVLAGLVVKSPQFAYILILHLLVFRTPFKAYLLGRGGHYLGLASRNLMHLLKGKGHV